MAGERRIRLNTEDVPKETLASAIVKISESLAALRKSGLNRKAIIVLLKDATNEPKTTIDRVLNALDDLKKDYCS